ncbi:MAG: hypothetical protein GX301_13660 [Gracilibacteraceae bacterium]|jgi:hypothetical protein|nr:hypothetical protein [Gracilibacteraceae bacterium]
MIDLVLVNSAFGCVILPIATDRRTSENTPQQFFSTEEKNKKRRKKKDCLSANEVEGVCQGLLKKIRFVTRWKRKIFFESNPQGLTFTSDRNELFLHSLFICSAEQNSFNKTFLKSYLNII